MQLLNKKNESFEQVQDIIDDSFGNEDELQIQFITINQANEVMNLIVI